MARRKLNALERKLHQAALTKPDNIISQQEIDDFAPSAKERLSAINFLLGTGLFVVLSGKGSRLLYKALTQDVIEVKKGLTEEETLVLDRIRAAGTQGIWTKHIKTQTQLHQTVVDKCLKTLTHKQLIKTVTDVRHATRKIYMLAHLKPAVELTGGPWFTDKELDTEFIKLLSDVCLKVVRDRSFPKATLGQDSGVKRLFPLSHSSYPTANQILGILKKSRVTETELTVQHIEMLLEVLIFDGQIEKIPAFHTWDGDQDSDTEEYPRPASKRRHRHEGRDDSNPELNRARRRRQSETDPDSDDMSSTSDGHWTSRKRGRHESKNKSERTKDSSSSRNLKDYDDSESGTEAESDRKRRRRRSRGDSDDDDTSEDDRPRRKRRRRHRSRHDSPDRRNGKGKMKDVASSSEGTDDEQPRRRIDNHPEPQFDMFTAVAPASRFVYRAIHDEKVSLGLNQSPCVVCPVFDFCRDGGPVNPQECTYHEPWLSAGSGLAG
ncbi:RNA polymerase Rpc34 subunit-domain-containing protein [Fomes fomentarius]|nr:RNA polymerase Rpc34 subunit-domain-containing protein [Fomes fomentarius]